jgi:hypothetical protein
MTGVEIPPMSGAVRRWAARRRSTRNDTAVNETGIRANYWRSVMF